MGNYAILSMLGGLALFLFGMHTMSQSLEQMAGGTLERRLKSLTDRPIPSLLLGIIITVVIQSSSATTVLLVGLTASGILSFRQTLYVTFGSNIGTTVTAWIFSLAGIEGDSLLMQMLKPVHFSPILAILGVALLMFSKKDRRRSIGQVLVGFTVLIYGMTLMSDAVRPLSDNAQFQSLLTKFQNPFLALAVSLFFTAIIQSSSAAVGILQAISTTGRITFSTAIPMIMGMNIGTCITPLLASIGATPAARRVAVSHIAINLLGTLILFPVFLLCGRILPQGSLAAATTATDIAIQHTTFNLITTALLLPASRLLAQGIERMIPEAAPDRVRSATDELFCHIDERLFRSPAVAVAECESLTMQMSDIALDTLLAALSMTEEYSGERADWILKQEQKLDLMEDRLATYLSRLSSAALSDNNSRRVSKMLHGIGNLERLGDHAIKLCTNAKEAQELSASFSGDAKRELSLLQDATVELLKETLRAYRKNDLSAAYKTEPLAYVISKRVKETKVNHLARLRQGFCSMDCGVLLTDRLRDYERISDHCSNLAAAVIEFSDRRYDMHHFLRTFRREDPAFARMTEEYSKKYSLNEQHSSKGKPGI